MDGSRYRYAVDQEKCDFKKVFEQDAVHSITVMSLGFLQDTTKKETTSEMVVTASGDYTVHFGPFGVSAVGGAASSGGGGGCCTWSCLMMFSINVMVLACLIQVGLKHTLEYDDSQLLQLKQTAEAMIHDMVKDFTIGN